MKEKGAKSGEPSSLEVEPATGKREPEPEKSVVSDAWNTCPNCGAALYSRTCKLWCSKNCGYFVSCSEL